MKRLLGLLLVMGMVGCGGKENAGNAVDPGIGADEQLVTKSGEKEEGPSNPNAEVATSTPAETVDPVAALEKLEAGIALNEQGEVIDVSLNGTDVTDAGLVHLKGLTKLQAFKIGGFGQEITDAGIADLQKALPDCKIYK